MPTPKSGYYTRDGKRVPGVTTILGKFKESGGLIHWSWEIAHTPLMQACRLLDRGLFVTEETRDEWAGAVTEFMGSPEGRPEWDYKYVRDHAADAGTAAHDMFECHMLGKPFDASQYPPDVVKTAEPAFAAAMEWAKQTRYEVVETEVSLVSEKHRFGGTRDAILVGGKRALGDVKTSKGIYPDYLAQLGAYAILDEEHGNEIDGGFHLLKFSKQEKPTDPVRFSHHHWSHLDQGKRCFLILREAYDLMADLARLCK